VEIKVFFFEISLRVYGREHVVCDGDGFAWLYTVGCSLSFSHSFFLFLLLWIFFVHPFVPNLRIIVDELVGATLIPSMIKNV
jgi:hypothetical protein